ncbi:kinase/pyrophosphorylase [Bacillaceae bacterium SIJ1]|uniref:pyruvate, water dikinase regulatory protein n=1 Tax=Litoribacterium kuwaitense TaxID=1398745 RepID=UPI0013ED4EBA|nr:pyruvate, water dikinase regulatory protein [Litoribacterium kuwaitense]NGP43530.1 kinase/pyrophosphorylase [Litoribacterium kuwaitense]
MTSIVYIVSDSVGETAELVAKAAMSQFEHSYFELKRVPYVEDEGTLKEIVQLAKQQNALIGFTLVIPRMRETLLKEASVHNVPVVDLIGPLIQKMSTVYNKVPKNQPGLVHKLDADYFQKVDAIEFAVRYDDGRDKRGVLLADIVLIGVSRTSKTPLSQYLAHKKMKVANVPMIPEVKPPQELFHVSPAKCIGLTIQPEKLNDIRRERLRSLGLKENAGYADPGRIHEELAYFEDVIQRIGCHVIDVTNKAVEETANLILSVVEHTNKA